MNLSLDRFTVRLTPLEQAEHPGQNTQCDRFHDINILGSRDAVACAAYIGAASAGRFFDSEGRVTPALKPRFYKGDQAGGSIFTEAQIRRLRAPLFDFSSVTGGRVHGPQPPSSARVGVLIEAERIGSREFSYGAGLGMRGRWWSKPQDEIEFLKVWSARCPDVLFSCFSSVQSRSLPEAERLTALIVARQGQLISAHIVDVEPPKGTGLSVADRGNKLVQFRNAYRAELLRDHMPMAFIDPEPGKVGIPRGCADTSPDLCRLINKMGPRYLVGVCDSLGHGEIEQLTGLRYSGMGLIDFALMTNLASFMALPKTKKNKYGDYSRITPLVHDYELENQQTYATLAPRIDPERVRELCSLCHEYPQIAEMIGGETGWTVNGCHVIALMARVTHPGTIEHLGVKAVLDQLRISDPSAPALAQNTRESRTRAALATSGNSHAWLWLLKNAATPLSTLAAAALEVEGDAHHFRDNFGMSMLDSSVASANNLGAIHAYGKVLERDDALTGSESLADAMMKIVNSVHPSVQNRTDTFRRRQS
jgi:hypothetical protein